MLQFVTILCTQHLKHDMSVSIANQSTSPLGHEYVPFKDDGITRVVRIKIYKGEIVQDCDVYIGRENFRGGWKLKRSKWANPLRTYDYGNDRELVIKEYKAYIMNKPELLGALHELKGKR